jgi:hypothetical protein
MFMENPFGDSPHGQLLAQMQGMIAEYERSQIADRPRRGRLHKARKTEFLPWAYRVGSTTLNRGEVIRSLKHTGPTCILPDGIAKLPLEESNDGPAAPILSQPGLFRQRAGGTGEHHYP